MPTTLEENLAIIKKYCQIEPSDISNDEFLTIFLEDSKAFNRAATITTVTTTDANGKTIDTTTVTYDVAYRPFIVAARFLTINPLRDGVIEASGTDTVKWIDQSKIIDGLLNLQLALDRSLKHIPIGWENVKPLHILSAFLADEC